MPSCEIGIQIKRIFVGSQCSDENRQKLIDIVRGMNIEIYEMYLDDIQTKYELSYRLIT